MITENYSPLQALQTLKNIVDSTGYRETDGDNWLGPRLFELHDFIVASALPLYSEQPCPFCGAMLDGSDNHSLSAQERH